LKKESIKTVLNIASPVASAGSLLLPPLVVVPIIASVYNEVCSYWDSKSIKNRLQSLQDEIEKHKISIDDFAQHTFKLGEHEQYVLRNNIKHLCLMAQPETTDMLNKAIIECVMKKSFGLAEHACEILQQCNATDITLLKLVKDFQVNGPKDEYKKKLVDAKKSEKSGGWQDRNIAYGEDTTIFWKDFTKMMHLDGLSYNLGGFLSLPCKLGTPDDEWGGKEYPYLAYLAKSILKMQNLGVLQCEYYTTLNITSSSNIERFHITLFGKKLLEYIDVDTRTTE